LQLAGFPAQGIETLGEPSGTPRRCAGCAARERQLECKALPHKKWGNTLTCREFTRMQAP
ncbi:MAG: hypothetical protein ACYCT1_19675, partial [Steroidobacteraceae bacterium]